LFNLLDRSVGGGGGEEKRGRSERWYVFAKQKYLYKAF
jgi:hypothetical protein